MSVAVTKDNRVVFGSNRGPGVFRFAGDDSPAARPPLLPGAGGVAADAASIRWAATQGPNQVCLFEGEELVTRLQLPGGKRIYRQGLLSFAPAGGIVVAAGDAGKAEDSPWLILFQTGDKKDALGNDVRVLFKWDRARMADFVVGPRMWWDGASPSPYRSVY